MTDRPPHASSLRAATFARVRALVGAIRDGDESKVKDAVLRLSQSRRALAPLAFIVGAFAMLFEGLKLLVSNWRLTLVQVLPAMWIWVAMFDLKAHLLRGKSFIILRGPILIPVVGLITAVTAASFFLNAVFAFAIATSGPPEIRPAMTRAWSHRGLVLAWGVGIGLALGLSTVVVARWGLGWFTVSLSVVIGVMMFCYVAVPSRLVGVQKSTLPRRDRMAAAAVGGAIGAIVCTPPYLLGRLGLLMLGSQLLLVPGIIVLAIGLTLQAGATGSVKAIKMSATLIGGQPREEALSGGPRAPTDSEQQQPDNRSPA